MEKKNCIVCNKEFEQIHTSGHEQKYCSSVCRNKSANNRRLENIKNKIMNESQENYQNSNTQTNIGSVTESHHTNEKPNNSFATRSIYGDNQSFGIIQSHFETKIELVECKLRLENLQKEYDKLLTEKSMLEVEIEELENEMEQEPEQSGMIGAVMEQFKTDPINTISFAKELISKLFEKPKEVA